MQTEPRAVRDGMRARLLNGLVVLVGGACLAIARWLTPATQGHGTHQQLGLDPCSFLLFTGKPCPLCGGTTAFAHLVRGELFDAVAVNPLAVALFVVLCASVGVASAELVSPRGRWRRIGAWIAPWEGWLGVALVVLVGMSWGYRVLTWTGS